VIEELLTFGTVQPGAPSVTTAASIYIAFMETPPPPKITLKSPDSPWDLTWRRLWLPHLSKEESDLLFRIVHGILPVKARLSRFGIQQGAHCPHCQGVPETISHLFTSCSRSAPAWQQLVSKVLPLVGPVADDDLLYLMWPPSPHDADLTAAIATYTSFLWATRNATRLLDFADVLVAVRLRPAALTVPW
jgi:hypothetical protein